MDRNVQDIASEKKNRIRFIKLLFLTAALVAVGIFVFLYFYNRYNDRLLYAERLSQMSDVTGQLFSGVEDVVRSRWGGTELQKNAFLENEPKNVDELADFMDKQTALGDMEKSQRELVAVDTDGAYYTKTGRKGLLAEQRYLSSRPERISFVSNSMFDNQAKMVYLMRLDEPVTIDDGEKLVTISYYGLMQNMSELSRYFKCDAYDMNNGMFVVDEQGSKIFSDSEQDILPGYNIYSVFEKMEYLHGTSFAQAKRELDETGLAYSNAVLDGEEYYYALYHMSNAAWTLVFTVPSRFVAKNTVELVRTSTGIILIFSLVMLCICATLIYFVLISQQRLLLEQERRNNEKLSAALKKAEHAEKQARDANKAKSDFLANMSHDIRTPMNAIMGLTQLMEHDENNPEKMKSYIHKVQSSSQHLLGLINDVLDMSKIESAEVALNQEEIILAEQLAQVENIIRPQAERRAQTFVIRVHEISHEYLLGDAVRIRQIIINLLSNSVKYTPKLGNIRLDLTELPGKDDEHILLQITVTDNGYGMTPEFLTHIFEPFTRAENSTINRVQGTGLGMAITNRIVELMGGTISVTSELDRGSCFKVTVPILINKNADYALEASRVLLVSQDNELVRNVKAALRESGLTLYSAQTKEEAEELLKKQKADVILLGSSSSSPQLPELVRSLYRDTNALIFCLEEAASERTAGKTRISGLAGVIPLPFFLSKLVGAVNRAFSQKNKTEESNALKGLHFLCAEDNELNAEILNALMEMNGADCVIYPNGRKLVEAFALVKPGEYDAILMDVQMPDMNGLDAARAIRNGENPLGKSIPIIAMTANAFSSDVQECLDAGMDAHVSKPLDITALEVTLQTLRDRIYVSGGRRPEEVEKDSRKTSSDKI